MILGTIALCGSISVSQTSIRPKNQDNVECCFPVPCNKIVNYNSYCHKDADSYGWIPVNISADICNVPKGVCFVLTNLEVKTDGAKVNLGIRRRNGSVEIIRPWQFINNQLEASGLGLKFPEDVTIVMFTPAGDSSRVAIQAVGYIQLLK